MCVFACVMTCPIVFLSSTSSTSLRSSLRPKINGKCLMASRTATVTQGSRSRSRDAQVAHFLSRFFPYNNVCVCVWMCAVACRDLYDATHHHACAYPQTISIFQNVPTQKPTKRIVLVMHCRVRVANCRVIIVFQGSLMS